MQTTLNPYKRLSAQHAVVMFTSPVEAVEKARTLSGWEYTAKEMERAPAFYGDTWDGMSRSALTGSADFAAKARALESKLDRIHVPTVQRAIVESPFGRPCVGAYLARDPLPCRRAVTVKSSHAPLSIVVSVNSYANVKINALESRGVAIAALVQSVAMARPVNLYLSRFCEVDGVNTNALVRFPTAPLDSHRLAYLLASQAFARGLFFALHRSAKDIFASLGKPDVKDVGQSDMIFPAGGEQYSQERECPFADDLRDYLRSDLLYIPGAFPGSADFDGMTRDPVAWVNATVAAMTKRA